MGFGESGTQCAQGRGQAHSVTVGLEARLGVWMGPKAAGPARLFCRQGWSHAWEASLWGRGRGGCVCVSRGLLIPGPLLSCTLRLSPGPPLSPLSR